MSEIIRSVSGISGTEGHGPFFRITFETSDGRVVKTSIKTIDCLWTNVIGGVITSRANGRRLEELSEVITAEAITECVPGIPAGNLRYIDLALAAVRLAAASSANRTTEERA